MMYKYNNDAKGIINMAICSHTLAIALLPLLHKNLLAIKLHIFPYLPSNRDACVVKK